MVRHPLMHTGHNLLMATCYSHIVCVSCYRTDVQHACLLYHTSEVHNHPFLIQCYYIDLSAADLTMYEGQRE